MDVAQLNDALWSEPGRALLLKERRAKTYEIQALAGRRFTNHVLAAYQRFESRLQKRGRTVPDRVYNAAFDLINTLEVPVNHLTDRLDGEPPEAVPRSRDRTSTRYAADRRSLEKPAIVHRRIAPGAATGAIQQRYMQHVRRMVHHTILTSLQSYEGPALEYDGRRIVNMVESEVGAPTSADVLTAAVVNAIFPLWGATTTPDVVRKSRRSRRTGRR